VDASEDYEGLIVDLVPLENLANKLEELGEEGFLQSYSHPFLILVFRPPLPSKEPGVSTEKTLSTDIFKATLHPVKHKKTMQAVPVKKTNRNAYKTKITVGRAKNNDIVIRARKVSKIHGTFVPQDRGRFEFMDMGSSNSSIINGTHCKAKKPILVESGDRIAMWRYIFEFMEPEDMVSLLRELFGK
jgi:hypothetical protein